MTLEQLGGSNGEVISEDNEAEIGAAFHDIHKTFTYYEEDLERLEQQTTELHLADLDDDIENLRSPSQTPTVSEQLRIFSEEIPPILKRANTMVDEYFGQDSKKVRNAVNHAVESTAALEAESPRSSVVEASKQACEKVVHILTSPADPEAAVSKQFAELELTPDLERAVELLEDAIATPPSSPGDREDLADAIEKLRKHVDGFSNLAQPVSKIIDVSKEMLSALTQ